MTLILLAMVLFLAWGCAIAWRGHGGELDPVDPIGDWDEVLADLAIGDGPALAREIRAWENAVRRHRRMARRHAYAGDAMPEAAYDRVLHDMVTAKAMVAALKAVCRDWRRTMAR